MFAWTNPHVGRIEPFLWSSGEWRTRSPGMFNVHIVDIQSGANAMALSGAPSPSEREALAQPDAVLVDAADLQKLQVAAGLAGAA